MGDHGQKEKEETKMIIELPDGQLINTDRIDYLGNIDETSGPDSFVVKIIVSGVDIPFYLTGVKRASAVRAFIADAMCGNLGNFSPQLYRFRDWPKLSEYGISYGN